MSLISDIIQQILIMMNCMEETKEDHDASRTQISGQKRKFPELAHCEGDIKQGSPSKQPRIEQRPQSISSTQLAYSVMKFRLGGSVSDPLNLEGDSAKQIDGECSTCAPSPALPSGQLSPLPQHLQKDPLNIEGRTMKVVHNKQTSGGESALHLYGKSGHKRKPRNRRRNSSKSDYQDTAEKKSSISSQKFRYGNYDRYYGYRNSGVDEEDLRISMFQKEWFEGVDCLDIGCNTGQITIKIAQIFKPRKIVGIDIDHKLVQMAWKNLQRDRIPTVAPDGRPFPLSLLLARGPPAFLPLLSKPESSCTQSSAINKAAEDVSNKFPNNVEFKQCNYVPNKGSQADCQNAEYDTILALSLTKWIHLNWGDDGIKMFFRKIYNHLRPGGRLILEPQPYTSYSRKKKLAPQILKNYESITFFPRDFHLYLMSSEVGFTQHKLLGVPGNQSKGFRRPLHLYRKSILPTVPVIPLSIDRSGAVTGIEDLDTVKCKRLKSVIGGVSKTFTLDATRHTVKTDTCKAD
ncbi:probable RNA methyltransferase Y17G7B.18 isoform X1 [Halichondria panicea]|uniref:probable RNA methyltransferase Y17G7B.18 isoform X1 n=1 Tax=Halichondria panicea TaxID=6063 RepID=UPI00312BAFE2